ncbi:hypothetical protein LT493_20615 [Streptomyces tricolor]|nr:hypothetical protein [Streptomyces tricolor]
MNTYRVAVVGGRPAPIAAPSSSASMSSSSTRRALRPGHTPSTAERIVHARSPTGRPSSTY